MYLVSTSKKTVLSDFADLETTSEFVHQSAEPTDFQFNGQPSLWCCCRLALAFVQGLNRCSGGKGMSCVVTKCFYWSPGIISNARQTASLQSL